MASLSPSIASRLAALDPSSYTRLAQMGIVPGGGAADPLTALLTGGAGLGAPAATPSTGSGFGLSLTSILASLPAYTPNPNRNATPAPANNTTPPNNNTANRNNNNNNGIITAGNLGTGNTRLNGLLGLDRNGGLVPSFLQTEYQRNELLVSQLLGLGGSSSNSLLDALMPSNPLQNLLNPLSVLTSALFNTGALGAANDSRGRSDLVKQLLSLGNIPVEGQPATANAAPAPAADSQQGAN